MAGHYDYMEFKAHNQEQLGINRRLCLDCGHRMVRVDGEWKHEGSPHDSCVR